MEPQHRFGDLYALLTHRDWLAQAYAHIKTNTGAQTPGVDGVTRRLFEVDLERNLEVFQSQDIKFSRGYFFFLVCHNRLFFKGQHVVHVDRPIRMHHDLFDQQLDHRLAVLKTEPVEISPQEGTEVANIVCDVFPLDRGIALLFDGFSFLRESLEALDELLAAGRQVLQGNDLLLIGINEAL